ncbi:MAG: hypothetical protein E7098_08305 [Mediterranea massiliensis]|nr:hypothetical protein [Mediterranea massiliensis]
MSYKIMYNFNGKGYEDDYTPKASMSDISNIVDKALFYSLRKNNIDFEDGCLKDIKLFEENNETPIYSAVTFTEGMGFLLNPEEE